MPPQARARRDRRPRSTGRTTRQGRRQTRARFLQQQSSDPGRRGEGEDRRVSTPQTLVHAPVAGLQRDEGANVWSDSGAWTGQTESTGSKWLALAVAAIWQLASLASSLADGSRSRRQRRREGAPPLHPSPPHEAHPPAHPNQCNRHRAGWLVALRPSREARRAARTKEGARPRPLVRRLPTYIAALAAAAQLLASTMGEGGAAPSAKLTDLVTDLAVKLEKACDPAKMVRVRLACGEGRVTNDSTHPTTISMTTGRGAGEGPAGLAGGGRHDRGAAQGTTQWSVVAVGRV